MKYNFYVNNLQTVKFSDNMALKERQMNHLSKEKLNFQKNKKKLTNLKISQLTNIPVSNIDKIFSGANSNPTLDTIQKIANVLECSIDDFIDYKKEPVSPIYVDKVTQKIAHELMDNEKLKRLFNNCISLDANEIDLLTEISNFLTKRISK